MKTDTTIKEQTKLMIYSDYVADRIKMDNINQISLLKYVLLYRSEKKRSTI